MIQLKLYGTSACHLCEQAEQLLEQLQQLGSQLIVEKIDISNHPQLEQAYGIRIPVVREPGTGTELAWPFDLAALNDFIVALQQSPCPTDAD